MTIQFIEESTLTAMADAIRAGTGKTGTMKPSNMSTEIAAIKTYSREGKYVWSVQSGDCTTVDVNAETKYVASNDKNAYPSDGWIGSDYFKLVKSDLKIVTWADGTDDEIVAMVAAADKGDINLSDYWSVGDTRTVHLSAMAATGVGETHAEQDVELVLMHAGEYKLNSAVESGRDTCSFVVGMKDGLAEAGYMNSSNTNSSSWDGCARRTWCNNVFKGAIPSSLLPIFKQFKTITAETYNGTTLKTSVDWFALAAEREIFGAGYGYAGNGYANNTEAASTDIFQFTWYQTSANRIKKHGTTGSAGYWWGRSPRCYDSSGFCYVRSSGKAGDGVASYARGLAPFGCI